MTSAGASAITSGIVIEVESKKPYTMDNIPGVLSERVFIGGNYKNIAVLREISRMVLEKGYQPILAADFSIPRNRTRIDTLRLLHNCDRAIFEISFRGDGHTTEINKTKEYGTKTLLVYQIMSVKDSIKVDITSMIDIDQYRQFKYRTFKELEDFIDIFFLFDNL